MTGETDTDDWSFEGPDYDKYAEAVLDSVQQKGNDFTDPDVVEEEAREMAEMLVLDEATLVEKAREHATVTESIGNISEVAP